MVEPEGTPTAAKPAIPESESDLTAGWMQQALTVGGEFARPLIVDVAVENIGAEVGMVGRLLRCNLVWRDGDAAMPETVIVKLHSSHRETFETARTLQLYRREFEYYRQLAPHVPLRAPALLYGDFDSRDHRFVLVLEDLGGMTAADQIVGASAAQAMTAVRAIARLHGLYWNQVDQPPVVGFNESSDPRRRHLVKDVYQASLPGALDRFGGLFPDHLRRLAEDYGHRIVEHMDALAAGPLTFCHGDFRLDNMFFGSVGNDDFAVVDWQVCGVRSGLYDVAYFLSSSVAVEVRREIERQAIDEYHHVIRGMGVNDFTGEDCWRSYRQNMLSCFQTPIIAGGRLDLSGERSRQLADAFLSRTLTAIDDLDAGEFLPDSATSF